MTCELCCGFSTPADLGPEAGPWPPSLLLADSPAHCTWVPLRCRLVTGDGGTTLLSCWRLEEGNLLGKEPENTFGPKGHSTDVSRGCGNAGLMADRPEAKPRQTARGLGLQAHSTALTVTELSRAEQGDSAQQRHTTWADPQSVKKSVGLSLHILGLR